jgi:hypothetical protein
MTGRLVGVQMSLTDRVPAANDPRAYPDAWGGYYSHRVVWQVCLVWEWKAWKQLRGGAG